MKTKVAFNSFLAFALAVSFCPISSQAQAGQDAQAMSSDATQPATQDAAAQQMVPAQALLSKDLDSRKAQPGQQFQVTLSSNIQLKNGPELPRGTMLVGTIATDNTQASGTSSLALRFTQANLKDGKSIPIVATIVGIAPPANEGYLGEDPPPAPWDGRSLQADIVGALSGVDLHSKIASDNSGVFVSTKNSDVKLAASSQFALAIAAQTSVAGVNGGN